MRQRNKIANVNSVTEVLVPAGTNDTEEAFYTGTKRRFLIRETDAAFLSMASP
jgi:starch synthase (maltosyl-transferring)